MVDLVEIGINVLKSLGRASLNLGRWIVRKIKKSQYSKPLVSFDALVGETELRFIKTSSLGELPTCPYCEKEMMFRHSRIVVNVGPVRDDIGFKCVSCFHTAHFGIPMTREDALRVIGLRGGPDLSRPSVRPDEEDDEIIKERLRRLGYIE